jgi:hypothetical protein
VTDEEEYPKWAPVCGVLPNDNVYAVSSNRLVLTASRCGWTWDICRRFYDMLALLKPILLTHNPVAAVYFRG